MTDSRPLFTNLTLIYKITTTADKLKNYTAEELKKLKDIKLDKLFIIEDKELESGKKNR